MNALRGTHQRVAVVGGGWAGLSAAVRAASEGHHVTVYEASRQWGGRARSVPVTLPDGRALMLDNGQHILIGAYTDTLRLMQTVGVDLDAALLRSPLALVYPDGTGLKLPAWGMPDTRHEGHAAARMGAWLSHQLALPVVAGVWKARGWSWRDKLALLATAARWKLGGFSCAPVSTVAELCAGLPDALVTDFIGPLCVSALNTPAHRASGQVFLRVLKDALFGIPGGADLLLPRLDLGQLFPQAAVNWLAAPERNATLRLGTRVTSLQPCPRPAQQPPASDTPTTPLHPQVHTGMPTTGQTTAPPTEPPLGHWGWLVNGEAFDRVVLSFQASKQVSALLFGAFDTTFFEKISPPAAEPPAGASTALTRANPTALADDWVEASDHLTFEAIATVYAWCTPADHTATTHAAHVLPQPMTALRHNSHQPAQFVFDRSWLSGPKGLLAFVVSASQVDVTTLGPQVCAQAAAQLGLTVSPLKTIVEKRATFACTPNLHRPSAHLAPNLVAAGDHIAGPYPATLEGAVRSGWYAGGTHASTLDSNVMGGTNQPCETSAATPLRPPVCPPRWPATGG